MRHITMAPNKNKNVLPRSTVVVETFTSCEVGAQTSIRPSKALSSRGKRLENITRSPLQVDSCRKKSGRSQESPFFPKPSRFSHLILAHTGSSLLWPVDDRATLYLRQIWFLFTPHYVQGHACVWCATLSPSLRVPRSLKGHHIGVRERPT